MWLWFSCKLLTYWTFVLFNPGCGHTQHPVMLHTRYMLFLTVASDISLSDFEDSIFCFKIRPVWSWRCWQLPSRDSACSGRSAAVCRMESCPTCPQCWPASCCSTLGFFWLQPAGPSSPDSGLRTDPHPHGWCVHADSMSKLYHADLHTHTTAH